MKLDLALVHYPVHNKNSEIIGSAVTNLDLHDIARAGRTYGINTFYVIVPYLDQRQLVEEIMDHWLTGHGAEYNPDRKEAFSIMKVVEDLPSLYHDVGEKWGVKPLTLATSAKKQSNSVSFQDVRKRLIDDEPALILLGTGWGLAAEVLKEVDAVLPPVGGEGDYNHLSVRSAASIILDRLTGR